MEIAIVAGGAALLSITALVGLIVLSLKLSAAKDAETASATDAAGLRGELAIAKATIDTKTNEADTERKRANALDDALAQAEQAMEADPRGALARLLAGWKSRGVPRVPDATAGSAAVSAPGAMLAQPAPTSAAVDRDSLLKPGE